MKIEETIITSIHLIISTSPRRFLLIIAVYFQVWLIEINVNPSLDTNCKALRQVVPQVVKETLRMYI